MANNTRIIKNTLPCGSIKESLVKILRISIYRFGLDDVLMPKYLLSVLRLQFVNSSFNHNWNTMLMYISLWTSSPVAFIQWAIVFKRTCKNAKGGGSTRARKARNRSPIPKKMWQYTHPRNFGNHVTVRPTEQPPICPYHRETNVKSHTF